MRSKSEEQWNKLRDKEYREQFVTEQAKRGIPFQVQALIKQQGLTQQELAERAGLSQGVVSRSADLRYGNLTMNTIVRLAAGFDVAFVGEFVPFSKLVDYFDRLSSLGCVLTFTDEDARVSDGEAMSESTLAPMQTGSTTWRVVLGRGDSGAALKALDKPQRAKMGLDKPAPADQSQSAYVG